MKKPRKTTGKKRPDALRWRKAFLAALAISANVTLSARAAGIDPSTAYDTRREEPAFASEWKAALAEAYDQLEAEGWRRAKEGLVRFKFYKGKPLRDPRTKKPYYEIEYSDTLLMFFLNAGRPKKYRQRHEVKHGGRINVAVKEVMVRSREEAVQVLSALPQAS